MHDSHRLLRCVRQRCVHVCFPREQPWPGHPPLCHPLPSSTSPSPWACDRLVVTNRNICATRPGRARVLLVDVYTGGVFCHIPRKGMACKQSVAFSGKNLNGVFLASKGERLRCQESWCPVMHFASLAFPSVLAFPPAPPLFLLFLRRLHFNQLYRIPPSFCISIRRQFPNVLIVLSPQIQGPPSPSCQLPLRLPVQVTCMSHVSWSPGGRGSQRRGRKGGEGRQAGRQEGQQITFFLRDAVFSNARYIRAIPIHLVIKGNGVAL